MPYVPDAVAAAMRGDHPLGIFFRIDTVPPLRIWLGVSDIPASIDGYDVNGNVYLGGGRLLNIPSLEVLIQGGWDSVEFQLSGLDPKIAVSVIDQLPPYRGRDVHVGITTLDPYFQPMSKIVPLWSGIASHTDEHKPPVAATDPVTITLSLTVFSGLVSRSRPARSLWSSAHHKAVYPTDDFCDGTSRLARGVAPSWPRY